MAKYIESTLIKDEKIILTPELHKIVYLKPFLRLAFYLLIAIIFGIVSGTPEGWGVIGVFGGVFVLVELGFIIYDCLYYPRVEMAVTNKRVVNKTGIIGIESEELQWNRIESIEIRQGIWGRLLNYGDVCFSGVGVSFVRFGYVKNPREIKLKSAEILSK